MGISHMRANRVVVENDFAVFIHRHDPVPAGLGLSLKQYVFEADILLDALALGDVPGDAKKLHRRRPATARCSSNTGGDRCHFLRRCKHSPFPPSGEGLVEDFLDQRQWIIRREKQNQTGGR